MPVGIDASLGTVDVTRVILYFLSNSSSALLVVNIYGKHVFVSHFWQSTFILLSKMNGFRSRLLAIMLTRIQIGSDRVVTEDSPPFCTTWSRHSSL